MGACGANAVVWRYGVGYVQCRNAAVWRQGAGYVRRKCYGMAVGRGVRCVSETRNSAWGVFGGEMLSARRGVRCGGNAVIWWQGTGCGAAQMRGMAVGRGVRAAQMLWYGGMARC